jgi:oligoribonuclease
VVTDLGLQPLEQYDQVVFQPPEILEQMHPWCVDHHGKSGLTAACATGIPLVRIEQELMALTRRHHNSGEKIVIAGNSISTDRRFIDRWMPRLAARLHYRMLDVSAFKVVFQHIHGIRFKKSKAHRAVEDILESIGELKYYLQFIKVPPKSEREAAEEPKEG